MGRGDDDLRPPEPDAAPGGPSPEGDALAGRWLLGLEALTARAAHEVNNALNGAVMNLEVVRLRARPGVDGAGAAPFAESAAGELERAAAYVGAFLALARAPRGGGYPDVGEVLQQVGALVAPALAQRRVTLALEPGRERATTAAPLHAVRLAVLLALLGTGDRLADGSVSMLESGGADSADESVRLLRCTLRFDPAATLVVHPAGAQGDPLPFAPADRAALEAAGIEPRRVGDALLLQFPGR